MSAFYTLLIDWFYHFAHICFIYLWAMEIRLAPSIGHPLVSAELVVCPSADSTGFVLCPIYVRPVMG